MTVPPPVMGMMAVCWASIAAVVTAWAVATAVLAAGRVSVGALSQAPSALSASSRSNGWRECEFESEEDAPTMEVPRPEESTLALCAAGSLLAATGVVLVALPLLPVLRAQLLPDVLEAGMRP